MTTTPEALSTENKAIFQELDAGINAVLSRRFDMFFDREKARRILKEWTLLRTDAAHDLRDQLAAKEADYSSVVTWLGEAHSNVQRLAALNYENAEKLERAETRAEAAERALSEANARIAELQKRIDYLQLCIDNQAVTLGSITVREKKANAQIVEWCAHQLECRTAIPFAGTKGSPESAYVHGQIDALNEAAAALRAALPEQDAPIPESAT